MPKPVVGPCGGAGQPACPPQPAIQINNYPVVIETSDGQKHVVQQEDGDDDEQ
jgi:hypothetical protein